MVILGFCTTSPKFKLRNYRFFWVSTFMWYYSTLKPIYKQIFGSKGFFVLWYRTLEFPGFCVTQHLADGKESSYVGWKHYRFWEILISKHSLSQNKYYFNRYRFLKQGIHALIGKLKNRCFCWFVVAIFVPLKGTQTCRLSIQSFINLGKTFSEYLTLEILHRPDSWRGFLYIYLLSFPRF